MRFNIMAYNQCQQNIHDTNNNIVYKVCVINIDFNRG